MSDYFRVLVVGGTGAISHSCVIEALAQGMRVTANFFPMAERIYEGLGRPPGVEVQRRAAREQQTNRAQPLEILPSVNSTCFFARGSYFLIFIFSGIVRSPVRRWRRA